MTREAADPGDRRHAFGRDFLPHNHGTRGNPDLQCDPPHQATLRTQQLGTGESHAAMISLPYRSAQALSIRTPYAALHDNRAMGIAEVIRAARRSQKLSQTEVARRLGVAQSAVAQWENGVTMPSLVRRVELARLLGVSFPELAPEIKVDAEDTQIWRLIQQLMRLTPEQRTALLMTATAAAELLARKESDGEPN